MQGWKQFCRETEGMESNLEELKQKAGAAFDKYHVYPDSICFLNGCCYFISIDNGNKVLVIYGKGGISDGFKGCEIIMGNRKARVCMLTNENCRILQKLFPFTVPINHHGKDITIGLGDRLGFASPGHIRAVRGRNVFPVLAQQSIRELKLTGRTYDDVLCAASWAVFQEGYRDGFGADGDHLKTYEEVKMALDKGYTMITLDCTEQIDNEAAAFSEERVEEEYKKIDWHETERFEREYIKKVFSLDGESSITFTYGQLKKIILVYYKAIRHTIDIYNNVIKSEGRPVDFEMSIDETLTPTTPESHFFVAAELVRGGVRITSLAPRFCGEFQKGIDYIGDIERFKKEFKIHVKIASHFGYKISVHSGSDKFSVFPIVGEETGGRYHLKTAGTNWLEAVKVIINVNPALYRRMHEFALEHLEEAKKYYHISADTAKIPDIKGLSDRELAVLMEKDDSRQLLHITYGLILQAEENNGSYTFRDEIYNTLRTYEDEYCDALVKHIGRHLDALKANI
jgi:tagaturonate epimerase